MSCPVEDPMSAFGSGEWIDALVCTYADAGAMSFVALGLVVWFTVSSMTYIRTASLIMPIVYLLVLGSVALTQLPTVGLGVAALVIAGGGAGLVLLIARRIDAI